MPTLRSLTPAVVNSASPAFLHRFEWIKNEESIGALDPDWNFLEGEYPKPAITPRVIHYTNGGPWFEEWQDCDYADLWLKERDLYLEERGSERSRGSLADSNYRKLSLANRKSIAGRNAGPAPSWRMISPKSVQAVLRSSKEAIDFPEIFRADRGDHVEDAVESEGRRRRA